MRPLVRMKRGALSLKDLVMRGKIIIKSSIHLYLLIYLGPNLDRILRDYGIEPLGQPEAKKRQLKQFIGVVFQV